MEARGEDAEGEDAGAVGAGGEDAGEEDAGGEDAGGASTFPRPPPPAQPRTEHVHGAAACPRRPPGRGWKDRRARQHRIAARPCACGGLRGVGGLGRAAGTMELRRAVELRRAISAGTEAERAVRRYGALEETEWKAEALGRSEWGLPGGAAGGPAWLRAHPRAPRAGAGGGVRGAAPGRGRCAVAAGAPVSPGEREGWPHVRSPSLLARWGFIPGFS